MIIFTWGKFTAEFISVAQAEEYIVKHNLDLSQVTVTMKIKIPGNYYRKIAADVATTPGGKIL